MIIDIKIINAFNELQNKLPTVIENYKIQKTKITKALKIDLKTFNVKLRTKKFTIDEMYQMAKFINEMPEIVEFTKKKKEKYKNEQLSEEQIKEIEEYEGNHQSALYEMYLEEKDMEEYLKNYDENNDN